MRIKVYDLELEVEGDYSPKEEESYDCPGCPESFTVEEVRIPGNPYNYLSILSETADREIEDAYLEEIHDRGRGE